VDFSVAFRYLPFLTTGIKITVVVSLLGLALSLLLGLVVALGRLSGARPVRFLAGFYVDFFRSTPLFVQLVWFFYALPILTGVSLDAFTTGAIALGVYYSSFFAEIYRTGILAVPIGQREAALSQGMTSWQAMRRIVLPQAIRKVLPPAVSSFVSLFKDSSLVSILGVTDLLYQGSVLANYTLRPLEVMTVVALMYAVLTYPQTLLVNYLHRHIVLES